MLNNSKETTCCPWSGGCLARGSADEGGPGKERRRNTGDAKRGERALKRQRPGKSRGDLKQVGSPNVKPTGLNSKHLQAERGVKKMSLHGRDKGGARGEKKGGGLLLRCGWKKREKVGRNPPPRPDLKQHPCTRRGRTKSGVGGGEGPFKHLKSTGVVRGGGHDEATKKSSWGGEVPKTRKTGDETIMPKENLTNS